MKSRSGIRLAVVAAAAFLFAGMFTVSDNASASVVGSRPALALQRSSEGFFRFYPWTIGGKTINIFVGPPESAGGAQLALGLDNSLWYGINANPGGVMRYTPSSGSYKFFASPSGTCQETGVVEAADAMHMVFSAYAPCSTRYGFLTNTGVFTDYAPSADEIGGTSLVVGPDKRVWSGYCCNVTGSVVAISSAGKLTAYAAPSSEQIYGATVGPDKNIWYASNIGIGKITTEGKMATDYNPGFGTSGAIVAGPDGRMWFANGSAAEIGSINTDLTGLSLFMNGITGIPRFFTVGPNKLIYFSEYNSTTGQAAIASISTSGVVKEYTLPYGFIPNGITVGPDKNIWVVDGSHDQLGQLVISSGS